jgi:peptidoglycan/LPS O-acetylase OafA/YrhL
MDTVPGRQLPSLTSLRWFAASAVFALHGLVFTAGTPLDGPGDWIGKAGASGVSFFFILSGFVLTWSHRPERGVGDFYRRRVARVGPAYWLALAAAIPVAVVIHTGLSWRDLVPVTLLQSWSPDHHVYYAGNSVGWSLSDEAFFYLLFPFLIAPIAALRPRALVALAAGVVVAAVVVALALHPTTDGRGTAFWAVYILPATRLLEFILGICLARYVMDGRRVPVSPIQAGALALGVYLVAAHVPIYLMVVALPIVPFALLIAAMAQADLAGTPTGLRHPALVRLGQWSYAFYLFHFLAIKVIHYAAPSGGGAAEALTLYLTAYGAGVVAAALVYHFYERPLEDRIRRFRPRPAAV